jgi:ADP-ribose pyrophosphatase YjhB (NUDIX family)
MQGLAIPWNFVRIRGQTGIRRSSNSISGLPAMDWVTRLNPLRNRLFHIYFRFFRPVTMGVRGVVIDDQNRVLLVRHSYVPGWHIPGGGVEKDETAALSLSRELREEGNIEVTGPMTLHGIYFNKRASRRDHVLVYVVREFIFHGPRAPDFEIVESGFFALDALPPATVRSTRERLEEIFAGKAQAEIF